MQLLAPICSIYEFSRPNSSSTTPRPTEVSYPTISGP